MCFGCSGSPSLGENGTKDSHIVDLGHAAGGTDSNVDGLTLTDEHAEQLLEMIERNAADVPEGMPESLLAVDQRPAIVHEVESVGPDGDDLAGLLTVANAYATSVRGQLLCIRDWTQVPCANSTEAISIDLPSWSAVQHEFAFEDIEDSTVFALLLLEGDRQATDSTSMSHLITEPETWNDSAPPAASDPEYEVEDPFPGCGFAVFHDGRDTREDYEPPEVVSRKADVSVLLSACDDYNPVWMVPVLVRNRSEVIDLDWVGRPVMFERSLEFPIPQSVTVDPETESLQFAWYFREDGDFLSSHTPEVVVQ